MVYISLLPSLKDKWSRNCSSETEVLGKIKQSYTPDQGVTLYFK